MKGARTPELLGKVRMARPPKDSGASWEVWGRRGPGGCWLDASVRLMRRGSDGLADASVIPAGELSAVAGMLAKVARAMTENVYSERQLGIEAKENIGDWEA